MSYEIKLPLFEGPFDLLLFFIERDELDIMDIPISQITNDFLDYVSVDYLIEVFQKIKEQKKSVLYQSHRAFEYPSIQECIHALLDGGKTLTDLQAKRAEVKAKYPKPK